MEALSEPEMDERREVRGCAWIGECRQPDPVYRVCGMARGHAPIVKQTRRHFF